MDTEIALNNKLMVACICAILGVDIKDEEKITKDNISDFSSLFIQKESSNIERYFAEVSSLHQQSELQGSTTVDKICTRKIGCRCQDCLSFADTKPCKLDNSSAIATIGYFIKATQKEQLSLMLERPDLLKKFFDQITYESAVIADEIMQQEKFLFKIFQLYQHVNYDYELIIFTLVKSQTLMNLAVISFGYLDNTRWRALQMLFTLAHDKFYKERDSLFPNSQLLNNVFTRMKFPLPDEEVRYFSDKIYSQAYDMDRWISHFQPSNVTPKTTIIQLTREESEALRKICAFSNNKFYNFTKKSIEMSAGLKVPRPWHKYILSESPECPVPVENDHLITFNTFYLKLEEELNQTFFVNAEQSFFIKLSTRSPKDSKIVKMRQEELYTVLQNQFESNDHPAFSQEEMIAFIRNESWRQAFKVNNIDDAIDIMLTSERIEADFETHKSYAYFDDDLSIILRSFIDNIPPFAELRGFIKDYKLNALTQYQDDLPSSFLRGNYDIIKETVCGFYNKEVENRLRQSGLSHAVVDFGLRVGANFNLQGVILIEFNSFGFRSGSGCFDWSNEKDFEVMVRGPFEFRIF